MVRLLDISRLFGLRLRLTAPVCCCHQDCAGSLRCGHMRSCSLRNLVFHTLCYLSVVSLTVIDHLISIRLEALPNYYVLVLWVLPSRVGGERFARPSLKRLVVLWHIVHTFDCFQANSPVVGSANGNNSGSPLVSHFRRPTWRNGFSWVMILPTNKVWRIF